MDVTDQCPKIIDTVEERTLDVQMSILYYLQYFEEPVS